MINFSNNYNNEVLFEQRQCVGKIILNRPTQLNCLSAEMVSQMDKILGVYEKDSEIELVILKGNGKAFCSGGDIKAMIRYLTQGQMRFVAIMCRKSYTLFHKVRTCNKPVVSILDGIVMGAGAGLTMYSAFRIVTENTIFAMPEAQWGHFPDCGASHFLSRLPGFLGEYIGLTGAYLDGAEMLSCGLATHFVPSKDINTMEEALQQQIAFGKEDILKIINEFAHKSVQLKRGSVCLRMEMIDSCFSLDTVEEILRSLEKLAAIKEENWITRSIKSIKLSCPISLKLFLRLIREGRETNYEECVASEFRSYCHEIRETNNNHFIQGGTAKAISKDGTPQWIPSSLEFVTKEMVEKYFSEVMDDDDNNDDWKPLQLPQRSSPFTFIKSNL